jgi:hypothetical protein
MTVKRKLTVRHVFERDYEVEFKDGLEDWQKDYGSAMMICDCLVNSGGDMHDLLTHEYLFDHPVSKWRPAKGMHIFDANLYNVSQEAVHMTSSGTSVDAWLFEGQKDHEFDFSSLDDDTEGETS